MRLRSAYASVLGCTAADVALTTGTSDAVARVVAGLDLRDGDEVVTSDEEHPGLWGPLLGVSERHGVAIRRVPLDAVADAVGPRTRLVACSHVGWHRGDVAPPLAALDVPVLLDGAQALGAIPVDVAALGCAFYAAAGQKWLCGPAGTGMLYVAPEWRERLHAIGPAYPALDDPYAPFEEWRLHADARRHDTPIVPGELLAAAVASFDLLDGHGFARVHTRATTLAAELAGRLRDAGRTVAPRGDTTLVAFEEPDPKAALERLDAAGVTVRDLPGTPLIRASVGAWNDESDLERLLAALPGAR